MQSPSSTGRTDQGVAVSNSRLTNEKSADKATKRVDRAMQLISTMRGKFGSVQDHSASTISNLCTQFEASSAAEARMRDVDIARDTAALTRSRIL
jgi:flagellin